MVKVIEKFKPEFDDKISLKGGLLKLDIELQSSC